MDTVDITLSVTRAAAERLRRPGELARLGVLVSLMAEGHLGPAALGEAAALSGATTEERWAALGEAMSALQAEAAASGLTAELVDEELAAWKRERAERRRGLSDAGAATGP